MHLIDKQQGAQAVLLQAALGRVHLAAQVFDPSQHGVETAEVGAGCGGNDAGQGGFAHPGRPMQDQVADPIGLDRPAQQPARPQDRLLALELLQGAGPHPVGQGRQLGQLGLAVMAEQVGHGARGRGPMGIPTFPFQRLGCRHFAACPVTCRQVE